MSLLNRLSHRSKSSMSVERSNLKPYSGFFQLVLTCDPQKTVHPEDWWEPGPQIGLCDLRQSSLRFRNFGFEMQDLSDFKIFAYPPLPVGIRLVMILFGLTSLSTTTPKNPLIISSHVISP